MNEIFADCCKLSSIPVNTDIVFRIVNSVGKSKYKYSKHADIHKNLSEYSKTIESKTSELHEIVFNENPVKLFFDIEYYKKDIDQHATIDDCDDVIQKSSKIIDTIVEAIMKAFRTITIMTNFEVPMCTVDDVIVASASRQVIINGESEFKFSYHIIITNCMVANIRDAGLFAGMAKIYCPDDMHKYFDMAVYTNNSSFRTLLTPKQNSPGSKFMIVKDNTSFSIDWANDFYASLITFDHTKNKSLPVINIGNYTSLDRRQRSNTMSLSSDIETVMDGITDGQLFNLIAETSTLFVFDDLIYNCTTHEVIDGVDVYYIRTKRTHTNSSISCSICGHEHSTDNVSIIINVPKDSIVCPIYVFCHRAYANNMKVNRIVVCVYIVSNAIMLDANASGIDEYMTDEINKVVVPKFNDDCVSILNEGWQCIQDRNQRIFNDYKIGPVKEPKLNVMHIDKHVVGDYLNYIDSRVIYVCSETGTGKTESIIDYAIKNPDKSIAIIVPRILLGVQYMMKLSNTFKCHFMKSLSVDFEKCDRVLCVTNSIHKIKLMSYDLLVIDELVSSYLQFSSINGDCLEKGANTLMYLLKSAKRVVIIDAHMTNLELWPFMEATASGPGDRIKSIDKLGYLKHYKKDTSAVTIDHEQIMKEIRDNIKLNSCEMIKNITMDDILGMDECETEKDTTPLIFDNNDDYNLPAHKIYGEDYVDSIVSLGATQVSEDDVIDILVNDVVNNNHDHTLLINDYNRGKDQMWHLITDEGDLLSRLVESATNGTSMAVCCTTKKLVNSVTKFLKDICSKNGRVVRGLKGDTAVSTKYNIIYGLDEIITKNEILVFNTVITVGTSTVEQCDHIFCINTNADVISQVAYQQSQRFRTAKQFFYYINKITPRYLPTTRKEYRQYINNYGGALINGLPLTYTINLATAAKEYVGNAAWIFLETAQLIKNIAIRYPNRNLINLIKMTGATIKMYNPADNDIGVIADQYKMWKLKDICSSYDDELYANISNNGDYNTLKGLDKNALTDKINALEVDSADRTAYMQQLIALNLRTNYDYHGFMTPKFVKTYTKYNNLATYNSFKNVGSKTTYNEMSNHIKLREATDINAVTYNTSKTFDVLNKRKLMAESHEALFSSLKILGSDTFHDSMNKIVNVATTELTDLVNKKRHLLSDQINRCEDPIVKNIKAIKSFMKPYGMTLTATNSGDLGHEYNKSNEIKVIRFCNRFNYHLDGKPMTNQNTVVDNIKDDKTKPTIKLISMSKITKKRTPRQKK